MSIPTIYDPSQDDSLGTLRGGGRVVKILRENLGDEARFITSLSHVSESDQLLIPLWRPFQRPLLGKRIAKKQVLMIFDTIPFKYPEHFPVGLKGRFRMYQNLYSLKAFDDVITISHEAKKDIEEYLDFDPAHIHVIHLTTSSEFFKRPKGTEADVFNAYSIPKKGFCMYVGDTNWNKNLVTLAQAVIKARVRSVFVGKTFSLINDLRSRDAEDVQEFFALDTMINHPEQRDFKNFVKLTLYDDAHFSFPGYIPDEDIIHLFRKAACNMLLSRDEGFGLSFLEAATQSCPSVLSDIPVFKEVAGSAALYADHQEPEDIALKLQALSKSPKKRDHIGEMAYKRSLLYGPKAFGKAVLDVMREQQNSGPSE
jgi:alpha-1,3-rhamnosyl/mannosyltransferase